MKHRVHDRLQITAGYFLSDSVSDRGNTQRAHATTISLRNFDPPHRRRKVTPRRQPVPELVEVIF
jgi:hypothetical protein